ncbi:MAG: hypothetical protein LBG57_04855 [Treponema sp.]|jgi:hypothetical protein|nr:hypothetical protein [Treponema sp.]
MKNNRYLVFGTLIMGIAFAPSIKYLTKNRIVIVLALLIAFTSFPVFGQQKDSTSGNKNERDPFFSINAQFSYFPTFAQIEGPVLTPKKVYPYDFAQAPGYAIQLGMGLKLFNTVNALFDFGLDDPYMKEAMRIAGKIGTKYFDVMYIYKRTFFPEKIIDSTTTLPSEEYDKWLFPQDGEKLERKFNVGTLALMSPNIIPAISANTPIALQIGFIWNSINANLAIQSEKEIEGQYIAYADIDRNFNTYGFRLATDHSDMYHIRGKIKPIVETYVDFTWGNVNLSDEAVDAVGFSGNKKLMTYIVIRGNLGLAWETKISAKRSITYGLGIDFFNARLLVDSSEEDFHAVNDPAVFGIFARIGLVL